VFVVLGLASVAAGILALAYPGITLRILGIILGCYLVVWAGANVGLAVSGGEGTALVVLRLLVGFVGMIAGLVCLVRPGASLVALVVALGFWFILVGMTDLARGIHSEAGRGWAIFLGLLGLAAGIIVLGDPDVGLTTLALIVGIGLIARGTMETIVGLALAFNKA
jgi:uncharacterized membrane protein HdeD (DUF308 family)